LERIDASTLELQERVVFINRVSKTVKGGRIYKFSALCVVGDGNGLVGCGIGKASEVPEAIRKGVDEAKKNLTRVTLKGTTIPHETVGVFGAGRVLLKPAAPGTGVIAGGAVRSILELAGVSDVLSKVIGSRTSVNVVYATLDALKSMRTVEDVAKLREMKVSEVR